MPMLYQDLKYGVRFIIKNKIYSIINLTGLVLGLALGLIVYLIIYQEFTYDRFHKDFGQLYQVMQYEKKERGSSIRMEVSNETAEYISQNLPEFEAISKIPSAPAPSLMVDDQSLNDAGIYADRNIFQVFSFKLIRGNSERALESPFNIVISESLSSRFFSNQNPIGKILATSGQPKQFFTVTGIMKNIPVTSSIQFDYIIPLENFVPLYSPGENGNEQNLIKLYVKVNKSSRLSVINQKIVAMEREPDSEGQKELFLFPFSRLHIMPVRYKDASGGGMMGAIIGLSVLGFLILFVACVNYTNLVTALSLKRAKDTSIKKIYGSSRSKLTFQFILESFLFTLAAMFLGLFLAYLIIPWFNRSFNWNLMVHFSDPVMISGLFGILIITTLLSGSYPAFYLSGLNPLQILKGTETIGKRKPALRRILVIIQFFFAILLIIISISFIKQVRYIKTRDLGVNIENTIMFKLNGNLLKVIRPLKDEISRLSSVENVSFASQNPLLILSENQDIDYDGKEAGEFPPFSYIETDFEFVKTMGLKITNGRDFNRSVYTDSSNFIINEKAAKALGSHGAIGSSLRFAEKEGSVIGVINDYHMTHMNFPIKPLIIVCNKNKYSSAIVKFKAGLTETGTAEVRNIIEKFYKAPEMSIVKMRDAFENIYKENIFKVGKLSIIFSLLSLWIAGLGLISISMYNAELRTKEIGIRKVLGASTFNIILKLAHEYIGWVFLSLVFAIPAGYIVVNKIFSRTAYHTKLSFWIFIIAAVTVLTIAFCTVVWQTFRLARKNPAETLKIE